MNTAPKIEEQYLPQALQGLAAVVRNAPTIENADNVAEFTQKLRGEFGEYSDLVLLEASAAESVGDLATATKAYRRALATDPDSIVALNNLALLLVNDSTTIAEAAKLSDRSIEIAGRLSPLLDTRAFVAIAQDQAAMALQLLSEAAKNSSTAEILFHQAVARQKLGEHKKALEDLQTAMNKGLEVSRFSALEKAWYDEISGP